MASATDKTKPTIQEDYYKHEVKFREAAAGDHAGTVSGTLREFLETEDLPSYFQFKAYVALSAADEENTPWENFTATSHFLKKAEEALKVAKETYIHDPRDAMTLEGQTKVVHSEWEGLRERRKAAEGSDDGE